MNTIDTLVCFMNFIENKIYYFLSKITNNNINDNDNEEYIK